MSNVSLKLFCLSGAAANFRNASCTLLSNFLRLSSGKSLLNSSGESFGTLRASVLFDICSLVTVEIEGLGVRTISGSSSGSFPGLVGEVSRVKDSSSEEVAGSPRFRGDHGEGRSGGGRLRDNGDKWLVGDDAELGNDDSGLRVSDGEFEGDNSWLRNNDGEMGGCD